MAAMTGLEQSPPFEVGITVFHHDVHDPQGLRMIVKMEIMPSGLRLRSITRYS